MPTLRRRLVSRRPVTVALAVVLVAAVAAIGASVVAAKKLDCRTVIAGTYDKPAGALYNLSADGTITGSLSETSQVGAGQGDTFLGQWQCDGDHVTGHDYRWVDASPRTLSRTDWDATFTPVDGGTLTIHFEFARVPEAASAVDARNAPILFDDHIVAIRVATP